MQYYNKFYKMTYVKALNGLTKAEGKEVIDKEAKKREKIVKFYMKYGLKITQEAYEVKRSTLYNWQKKYKDKGIEGLINGDRSPRRKRQSQIRREIKEYIREYSIKYGKIHQNEIKPHLDKYCKDLGIKTISVASIGRTIRELKEKCGLEREQRLRLNARSGNLREVKNNRKAKERRKGYMPKRPGDLVQVDSVHLKIEGKGCI